MDTSISSNPKIAKLYKDVPAESLKRLQVFRIALSHQLEYFATIDEFLSR